MRWTVSLDPAEGFVRVTTSGEFNIADHVRMTEDILSRPFWRPGTATFFDHRVLDLRGATFDTMTAASSTHLKNDARIGDGKAAILMGSPAAFGTARQFEILTADKASANLRIFLDQAAALEWLRA